MMTDKTAVTLPDGVEPSSLAQEIAAKWTTWDIGREKWRQRYAEILQYIYATSTKETTNKDNGWSHTTHIPKLTQIYDNLGANYAAALFGSRKYFVFEPATRKEANKKKDKIMRAYLDTKHEAGKFRDVVKACLNDWSQSGNCFAKLEYIRETVKDPVSGQDIVVYEGPKLRRISPLDIVFDYSAVEFRRAPKIVRSLVHRAEIERSVAEGVENQYDLSEWDKFQNFRQVVGVMSSGDIAKQIQQQYDGFANAEAYYRSGKVEVLELYGDVYDSSTGELHSDRLITVLDRRFVIGNRALADLNQLGQIYHCGWRKRPDNLWAMGPLDNLLGMQYLIDHLENARADAFDQMLGPDRVVKGNVEVEQEGPITTYYCDDAQGDVHNLAPDSTALNADLQIERKENQMEAFAGAPREAMGIRSPGEKTAFEVEQLQNAASRLFQTKIEDFEIEFLELVMNGEIELAVRNLQSVDIGKVLDNDLGVQEFLKITKDDLTVKGRVRARGASHFAKRAQRVKELQGFETVLATAPDMKVHFPGKARAEAWNDALGFDDLELFQPFGGVEEALELQKRTQAAQRVGDNLTAAANAPDAGVPTPPITPPAGV